MLYLSIYLSFYLSRFIMFLLHKYGVIPLVAFFISMGGIGGVLFLGRDHHVHT